MAVATGLASGEIEPTGWPMAVVALAGYNLALVGLGVTGALPVVHVFRRNGDCGAAGFTGQGDAHRRG